MGNMMVHQRTTYACQYGCCNVPVRHRTLRAREKRAWRRDVAMVLR